MITRTMSTRFLPATWASRLAASGFAAMLMAAPVFAEEPKPAVAGPIAITQLARTTEVDFQKEILPLMTKSCTSCHNKTDAKGDLVLESPQTILAGGESGPAVVPGKGLESLLLKLAAHQEKPVMPPKNNKANAQPLKPDELGLIKLWIDQGAKGQVILKETPIQWQPLPAGLNPIYAISVSPDGQFVAAGRANQVFIYHVPTKSLVTRLTDPAFNQPGVAHRDLVQSLAFSPQGDLLASGGYRVVKLWRRPMDVQKQQLALGDAIGEAPRDLVLSPDGKWLATPGVNHTIKLFDLTTGKHARDLTGHTAKVNAFAFAADSAKLITASDDKTVRLFTVNDGKQTAQFEATSEILSITWLAKDAKLATGHADQFVRIWDAAVAFAPKVVPPADKPADKPAEGEAKAEGDAKAQDKPAEAPPAPPALKPLHELKTNGTVNALAIMPNNDAQFLAGAEDGTIHLVNSADGKSIRQFPHGAAVVALAVRSDGLKFASAGGTFAKLWKIDSPQGVVQIQGQPALNDRIEDKQRLVVLADQHIAYFKKLTTDTEARKKAETDALAKANEAMKKAEEDLKAKDEAFKKATETQATARQALVDAETALKQAMEAKAAGDLAATKAKDDAQTAANKAKEATDALAKVTAALKTAEATHQDQQGKLKATTDKLAAAREASAAKPEEQPLIDAVKAAEQELADHTAKATEAAQAFAAAQKASEDATKAKADGDKLKTDADAMKQAADAAKQQADKALADATNKKNAADQMVKAQDKPVADSKAAFETSQRNKDAAVNAVANVTAGVERVDGQLTQAQTSLKTAEESKVTAAADVETAKKAATDANAPITALAFSANGGLLAVGSDAQVVQTFSGEDGSPVATYRGHAGAVQGITFTADGNIISSAADHKAIVWDVAAPWKLERAIGSGETDSPLIDRVLSLAFSPDGKLLATGGGQPSRSGELKLWNVADGSLHREMKDAHSDTVFGLEFSFDGTHLASCAADKFVKTWTVADGKFVMSFEGHTHHVLGVSWMADGRTLASSGADGVIKVWDFVIGGQKRTIKGGDKEITSVDFIGVTDTMLTSAGDNIVRTVKENGSGAKNLPGNADAMYCAAVTPDGKVIAAGGQDSVVRIWNGAGAEIAKFAP